MAENSDSDSDSSDLGRYSPKPCSILSVGQTFFGTQNMLGKQNPDFKNTKVLIQGLDLENGYLCGTMECIKPSVEPVVTFWEGEIIDTKNHTFLTGKWQATVQDDAEFWSELRPFETLMDQASSNERKLSDLSEFPHIFMRWKEKWFVKFGAESGLKISGFYYICFSVDNGFIFGYYHDPDRRSVLQPHTYRPFQIIGLSRSNRGECFSSPSYELL